jgi:hypothetical protein
MEKERKKIKIKPKKMRKTWQIKPTTRIHSEQGYKRAKVKEEERQEIEEE